MTGDEPSIRGNPPRRRVLATAAAAAVPLVAGCQIDASNRDDEADDDPPYNAALVSIDDHPISESAEFTEEQPCPVCNMQPADYPRWNCQLVHNHGTGLFFDSPGCLLAYRAITRSHPTDAPIERVWFSDRDTGELFDAADGVLVRETDLENQGGPMSGSPVPFSTRERAVAYVEERDHLNTDDIITLDDVDYELAEFYRGDRMPAGNG